jgi:acetyl-CoA carboxylase / biotin carboxylase 1
LDPTINPEYMEMYADEESRGGVLEPEGTIGLKYRREKQLETMARLDATYAELKRRSEDKSLTVDQLSAVKAKLAEREKLLLPVYGQIALQFADLHDRAGRMEAKGAIRRPLQWKHSRRFFYWRLRRRLNEEQILKKMAAASTRGAPVASRQQNLDTLHIWTGIEDFDKDDRAVAMWYEENRKDIHARLENLRAEAVAFDVVALLRGNKEGGLMGVKQMLALLSPEEREKVLKDLASK